MAMTGVIGGGVAGGHWSISCLDSVVFVAWCALHKIVRWIAYGIMEFRIGLMLLEIIKRYP